MSIPDAIALIGVALAILTAFLSQRRDRADVASKYQELASKQAVDNKTLEDEIKAARVEIALLHNKVEALMDERECAEEYITELTEYIGGLVKQLMEQYGIRPAKPPPVRKKIKIK